MQGKGRRKFRHRCVSRFHDEKPGSLRAEKSEDPGVVCGGCRVGEREHTPGSRGQAAWQAHHCLAVVLLNLR